METTFDPVAHVYRIGGVRVPSVTQVVHDVLPAYEADAWHLSRGRTVHACAAAITLGQSYTLDLIGQSDEDRAAIEGQIEAARRFLAEVPTEILLVERQVFSLRYRFAGTLDLVARVGKQLTLLDYKSTTDCVRDRVQMGGYAVGLEEIPVSAGRMLLYKGRTVELGKEGRYRLSEEYDLRAGRREFLACLGSWQIREWAGLHEKGDSE